MNRFFAALGLLLIHIGMAAENIRIGNDDFAAEISTGSGGVLFFGTPGRNRLYTTPCAGRSGIHGDWINYGGDWIWTTHQVRWPLLSKGELVPPELNGKWRVVERSARRVVLLSEPNISNGVVVRRTFALDPAQRKLVIDNRLTRVEEHPQAVLVWSVTQLHQPRFAVLGVRKRVPGIAHVTEISRPHRVTGDVLEDRGTRVIFHHARALEHAKIGTLGGWVAAVYDEDLFLETVAFSETGCYPELSSVQVYANSAYLELELLSPTVHLPKGGMLDCRVEWRLIPLTDPACADIL